eukprot:gene15280-biopygen14253
MRRRRRRARERGGGHAVAGAGHLQFRSGMSLSLECHAPLPFFSRPTGLLMVSAQWFEKAWQELACGTALPLPYGHKPTTTSSDRM